MSYGNYEFRYVRGHIEVFLNMTMGMVTPTSSSILMVASQQTGSEGGFDKQGRYD